MHCYYESRRRQKNDEREDRAEQVKSNIRGLKRRSSQKQESFFFNIIITVSSNYSCISLLFLLHTYTLIVSYAGPTPADFVIRGFLGHILYNIIMF